VQPGVRAARRIDHPGFKTSEDRMSDPSQLPGRPRSNAWAIFLILLGAILLLPGLCAVGFMIAIAVFNPRFMGEFPPLWLVCFAIAGGGIALIRLGLRRRRGADSAIGSARTHALDV
jgi:hypothetical protein